MACRNNFILWIILWDVSCMYRFSAKCLDYSRQKRDSEWRGRQIYPKSPSKNYSRSAKLRQISNWKEKYNYSNTSKILVITLSASKDSQRWISWSPSCDVWLNIHEIYHCRSTHVCFWSAIGAVFLLNIILICNSSLIKIAIFTFS